VGEGGGGRLFSPILENRNGEFWYIVD